MNTAFITGHRFGFDDQIVNCGINQLTDLALNRGITTFLTGMALGTDLLAAQIWIERQLSWEAIRPCGDQCNEWTWKQQERYYKLLNKATKQKTLYSHYSKGVMQARNQYLVNNSDLCLTIWNGRKEGGTFLTIQMARKAKLPLIIFNPKTELIEIEEPLKQLSLFD